MTIIKLEEQCQQNLEVIWKVQQNKVDVGSHSRIGVEHVRQSESISPYGIGRMNKQGKEEIT